MTLYVTVFLCSIGAATQSVFSLYWPNHPSDILCRGWDQTGSNGASKSVTSHTPPLLTIFYFIIDLSFPLEFGIFAKAGDPNYERDSWLVGLINAAPYIASAFCSVQFFRCFLGTHY